MDAKRLVYDYLTYRSIALTAASFRAHSTVVSINCLWQAITCLPSIVWFRYGLRARASTGSSR